MALFSFVTNVEISIGPLVIPAIVVSFLFLPVAMVDAIVFSNRFAGPMVNLRANLKRALDGERIGEIKFRPGDFFQDIADDFNRLNQETVNTQDTYRGDAESHSEKASPKPVSIPTIDSGVTSRRANSHV